MINATPFGTDENGLGARFRTHVKSDTSDKTYIIVTDYAQVPVRSFVFRTSGINGKVTSTTPVEIVNPSNHDGTVTKYSKGFAGEP